MASDRIVLDVGGTKFITAVSTLISNSMYFSSLLSGSWKERIDDTNGIFLDQDPIAFEKILAYMRRGTIQVTDVDVNVLSLSVFLGIEKLLIAIKVRWYNNIGRGEVLSNDEDIATKFDEVYGGISRAISTGLYPYFLKADDVYAEKDFAKLAVRGEMTQQETFDVHTVSIDEVTKVPRPPIERCGDGSIIGALNLLHEKGYTYHEKQLSSSCELGKTFSFSQRKHNTAETSLANGIFIPSDDELMHRQERKYKKQFALVVEGDQAGGEVLIGPSELKLDPPPRMPFPLDRPTCAVILNQTCGWLERNQFLTQEKEYEELFNFHINEGLLVYFQHTLYDYTHYRMYSRIVPK